MSPFSRRHSIPDLREKTVLITGGARGIGAQTARRFADEGATVYICDIDIDVAEETAAGIPGSYAVALDVTDRSSWSSAVSTIEQSAGCVDVLVNNAGVMPLGPFLDETEETTDLILDVNVRGVLNGIRAVIPAMIERKNGHIVNVASMAGRIAIPGMLTYNASKFGALGASLAARQEYDGTGVSICAILPAAVRTELSSGATLGGALPTVDPIDVADAVIGTLATRAAQTSVPEWVGPGWTLVSAVMPERLERFARKSIDDRRALSTDPVTRGAYISRVSRHAAQHSSHSRGAAS
ncbi:SDR family oxidoreductase [Gordonia sp. L191]|uniref:SDR family oxidoreductase n=1 Tax=Gordonia oryzae TaxID=2487349 RepID=A0A3N4G8H4_9ACTN|nr:MULTISPECIES: SDR family oxidoreductase [Gordonia]RPA59029.1 SDR family oxidoreductase [Gordonia oryzae]WHU46497.1 SDR family oxidoreductase [Gordonia sp. L191]